MMISMMSFSQHNPKRRIILANLRKRINTYNTTTGQILESGATNVQLSEIPLQEGQSIIEGIYEVEAYKIIDGVAVEQTIDFWNAVRIERDGLLKDCGWTQMPDSPLTSSKKTEWATYRQSLRDLPSTYSSAESASEVIFPTTSS